MTDWPKKMWLDTYGGGVFADPTNERSVQVLVYPADQALDESAIRASERERCAKWLEGAQVDEQGRLILTRSYIVACIRELGDD